MKIFVSSLITGMEPLRAAAREAITTLRHSVVMAEDFGAQPNTPEVACLSSLRQSDLVVLILGERYGVPQASSRSATHEEYEEAKGRKPVLAFVQEGVQFEEAEAAFVKEVQGWEGGLFRMGFRTADDLRRAITRALHDYGIANATGPLDQEEMARRAKALLPAAQRNTYSGTAMLNVAIAGGPAQSILRPVELERSALADALLREALFGENRLFVQEQGTKKEIEGNALVIEQERGARIVLNEHGSLSLSLPIQRTGRMGFELVYEVVLHQVADALGYASWVLDHIDGTQRLTHVAIVASLTGADHMSWRTQRESDASPNSMSVGMGNNEGLHVQLSQARPALRLHTARIAEDLVVPLRQQWR